MSALPVVNLNASWTELADAFGSALKDSGLCRVKGRFYARSFNHGFRQMTAAWFGGFSEEFVYPVKIRRDGSQRYSRITGIYTTLVQADKFLKYFPDLGEFQKGPNEAKVFYLAKRLSGEGK